MITDIAGCHDAVKKLAKSYQKRARRNSCPQTSPSLPFTCPKPLPITRFRTERRLFRSLIVSTRRSFEPCYCLRLDVDPHVVLIREHRLFSIHNSISELSIDYGYHDAGRAGQARQASAYTVRKSKCLSFGSKSE